VSTAAIVALIWLGVSLIVAPIVGRMIAGHTRANCPECIAVAASRTRHPSAREL